MEMDGTVEVEEGVMRVLLVDDSPVDRKVAQLLLLNSNSCAAGSFHVIAVDSAKKAMDFLGLKDGKEQQPIDMVLTDYCMPEMTGYDLLKAVKALNPLKPIPVIVMSSEDEPQRISRCLSAGAEDYIVKPLQSKDVQRLRNCSLAKPKGSSPCDTVTTKRKPPPDHAAVTVASRSGRRAHFTAIAMVMHSSSIELSHYFPLLCKIVLLLYAVSRPVPGRAAARMVIARLLTLAVVRLSSNRRRAPCSSRQSRRLVNALPSSKQGPLPS